MKNLKKTLGFLFFFLVLFNCRSLKNGDFLFVEAKSEGLSAAINNVTQKEKLVSFDHVGIVEKEQGKYFVLHADTKGGSQKQSLQDFIKYHTDKGQNIMIYRLKPEFRKTIPEAIAQAETMLGKPYNFSYILNDNAYYCSDFIERAFRKDHIFTLEPMTFIDPNTGKTNVFWQHFYDEMHLKVPEGELGCNPNTMAASFKLKKVRKLK